MVMVGKKKNPKKLVLIMFFLNQENIKLHPPSQNTVTVKLFYISVHFAVIRLEKKKSGHKTEPVEIKTISLR